MNHWRLIQISKPISLNEIYKNNKKPCGRGRSKTDKYKKWLTATGWEVRTHNIEPIKGPYQLELHVGRKSTRADSDNLIKPIADLLVSLGITEDDAKMTRCSSEFVTDRDNVLIRIKEHKI